jgi:hypothetical protein
LSPITHIHIYKNHHLSFHHLSFHQLKKYLFFCFFCKVWWLQAALPAITDKMAVSVSHIILFSDSSYTKQTATSYPEGELFEILGSTFNQHFDNDQRQKFKWFRVRTPDRRIGWVFGDGLARPKADNAIETRFKNFHKKDISLNNGFEKSVMWIASLDGTDFIYEAEARNPLYNETYLVITNDRKHSVFVHIGGSGSHGKATASFLEINDVTADKVPDVLLQRSNFPINSAIEDRIFEIYSMQGGNMVKIFEEPMTLTFEPNTPSPALFKHIEIDTKAQTIRMEYIEYMICDKYSLKLPKGEESKALDKCMEAVTSTYIWNKQLRKFDILYDVSRTNPICNPSKVVISLYEKPNPTSKIIENILQKTVLQAIKHYDFFIQEKQLIRATPYIFVRTPAGKMGYVLAKEVQFGTVGYPLVINKFYQNPVVSKADWKVEDGFVVVK